MSPQICLSSIFNEQLTKVEPWLLQRVPHNCPKDVIEKKDVVAKWINYLGEASYKAQGLGRQLTSTEKLENCKPTDDQTLYIYTDFFANNGAGEMVGLLRIGRKRLFFLTEQGMLERYPICILDFYVDERQQRTGIGRKLFDFMLQDQSAEPHALAIDRPSMKMISFMKKNYNLEDLTTHANRFAVSSAFFDGIPVHIETITESPRPVGRYSAYKPTSHIAGIIHGDY